MTGQVTGGYVLGNAGISAMSLWPAPSKVDCKWLACPPEKGGKYAVTKTSSGWDCVNNGGNTSNAENPKNPNAGKGFF